MVRARGEQKVRGGKLEIRKKLRRKSAEKMDRTFERTHPLETKGETPARGRKKRVKGETQKA
jgi:hypothetical protein